jgi:preprotein translocase subunit SecY
VLEKLRIIFTIPELRQKILLTLGLLAIYRVGCKCRSRSSIPRR